MANTKTDGKNIHTKTSSIALSTVSFISIQSSRVQNTFICY